MSHCQDAAPLPPAAAPCVPGMRLSLINPELPWNPHQDWILVRACMADWHVLASGGVYRFKRCDARAVISADRNGQTCDARAS